jgi:putative DNA-invertase from lambdoid prophage Rac
VSPAPKLGRLERGDVLVVSKLDRPGRNVVDVVSTTDQLAAIGVKLHCLQISGTDLTSAAGRLTMNVLTSVAQFEQDILIERTQAGLKRAWADGKKSGRRATLSEGQRAAVRAALEAGETVSALARQYETSRQTILRARAAARASWRMGARVRELKGPGLGRHGARHRPGERLSGVGSRPVKAGPGSANGTNHITSRQQGISVSEARQ